MNPDVFITIVFCGLAGLVALVGLVLAVPTLRREEKQSGTDPSVHRDPRPDRREAVGERGLRDG